MGHMTGAQAFFRAMLSGSMQEMAHEVFDSLLDDDVEQLGKVVEKVEVSPVFSPEIKDELKQILAFREYFADHPEKLDLKQMKLVREYDELWAEKLIRMLHQRRFETPDGDSLEYTPD